MNSLKLILVLFFLFLIQKGQIYEGTILRVIDGDTFVLQTTAGALKVRLDGIDCPEKKQPFGAEATAFLSSYLNKICKVEKKSLDRFGRTIGVLWVDGVNINLLMVQEGMAWHFKKYSKDVKLAQAEVEAKVKKKGLWQDGLAVAPWDWRSR